MSFEYVSIDLEVTGLKTKTDRIIEIGAVKVSGGKITETFSSFVNPRMMIPERITELTGIRDEMVADAPEISQIIREIVAFCEGYLLVGHHVITDYAFLKREAMRAKLPFDHDGIDTLVMTRALLPDLPRKHLKDVCDFCGIEPEGEYHRALTDAIMTAKLLECLKNKQNPESFRKKLVYNVKKDTPITIRQKQDLIDLLKYHKIEERVDIDTLTRSEASRMIDRIYSEYGYTSKGR